MTTAAGSAILKAEQESQVADIARYVNCPPDMARRFLGALEMCGYRLTPIVPPAQDAGLRVEHDFRMTLEEVTRIRNTGCGNDWPKVWNRQLNELCDAYRELRRLANAEQTK